MSEAENNFDLEAALKALQRDWSFLSPVLKNLDHDISTDCQNLRFRVHYPAIRQGQPLVEPFIDAAANYMAYFCLPNTEIEAVYAKHGKISDFQFHAEVTELNERAKSLFKKASEASNRNGEAGELLLFILTEWMLGAPQIIAKMSLKTNAQMPVHGADGIHVRFSAAEGRLFLYSGEAKLHKNVTNAIVSAVKSIKKSLSYDETKHEIELVQRNLTFSGLSVDARNALLRYLDPFDDHAFDRVDIITCLIGFDFDGYSSFTAAGEDADAAFRKLAIEALEALGPSFAEALKEVGLAASHVELFFLPVPSVEDLRDRFQDRIGWKR